MQKAHVESDELLMLVIELGCTAGQGFWLEAPLPAADIEKRMIALPLHRELSRCVAYQTS